MKMLVAGEWVKGEKEIPVLFPYDGTVVDSVPDASEESVERALSKAVEGARIMKKTPPWKRAEILEKTSKLILDNLERLTELLVLEVGKTRREARSEVIRTSELFKTCAEEARRIHGETLPFDSLKGSESKRGYFVREPAGVIVAITPFNVPLALCAHKVGPAIAAGNSVIIKPATKTPLSTIVLGELLLEAGMPPEALSVLTGSGSKVGMKLVRDPRVRVVSFTGSVSTGETIAREAGLKKLCMELGSNTPMIVCESADVQKAVKATVSGGFSIAGQVCISVQRVYVHKKIYDEFLSMLKTSVESLKVGDPRNEDTDMGPVIDEANARRIEEWINEAIQKGAKLVTGGRRVGTLIQPTVLARVSKETSIMTEELFGPAVAVNQFERIEEAIEEANSTKYGLQAAIFTNNLNEAFKAIEELQFGGVIVNETARYRADFMPYGGFKMSGLGREGVRFAIEEMTEIKCIVMEIGK